MEQTNQPRHRKRVWIVTAEPATTFYVQNLVLKPSATTAMRWSPGKQSVITRGAVVLRTAANCAP